MIKIIVHVVNNRKKKANRHFPEWLLQQWKRALVSNFLLGWKKLPFHFPSILLIWLDLSGWILTNWNSPLVSMWIFCRFVWSMCGVCRRCTSSMGDDKFSQAPDWTALIIRREEYGSHQKSDVFHALLTDRDWTLWSSF